MPCPRRFAAALKETVTTDDGVEMYTWRAVRRQNLRMLRKQTRTIVLFMALMEVVRVGAVDMVYAGRHHTKAPGPDDYGIAYNIGYFIDWLYMCLFAIIFVPFFSWWLPKLISGDKDPSAGSSKLDKVISVLDKINGVLLPTCIGLSLAQHVYYTVKTFIYVDARPVNSNTKSSRSLNSRQNWFTRFLLLGGVATSIALGKAVFVILEQTDLARVKPLEYLVIVLPIQINLGLFMGSAVQYKTEQRHIRKMNALKAADSEAAVVHEKQRLLVSPAEY